MNGFQSGFDFSVIFLIESSKIICYSLDIEKYSFLEGVMSFTEEKREIIKRYILNKIRVEDREFITKAMENFDISVTTVKRYLKSCVEDHILEPSEKTVTGYRLVKSENSWDLKNDGTLEEDKLYVNLIVPYIRDLSKNVQDIWYYTFTEIMNNAIEHSKSGQIRCKMKQDHLYTEISITDDGIGIFKNIRNYAKESLGIEMDTMQVMEELYKGKFTTNREAHSGEGIFFTSKMLTSFAIYSEDAIYSYRCDDKDQFVKSHLISYYTSLRRIGTMAVMKLENHTTRTSVEVFETFAPMGDGFTKTLLPMKELCAFGDPVARSQARRLVRRLEEFEEVILDFQGIEFMGQGFADELFRVFQNKNPKIKLTVINGNRAVLGMIEHVKK